MFDVVLVQAKEVLGALFRRMGTAFSAFLIAQDVPADVVAQFMVAIGVVCGLGFDVCLALFYRRRLRAAVKQLVAVTPPAPPGGVYYAPPRNNLQQDRGEPL